MEKVVSAGGGFIFVLLVVICLVDNNYNLLTSDQRGYRYFEKGEYKQAAEEFSNMSWKGAALYRGGRFEQAAAAFSGKDSPEALFNQGNSLLMLGKYEDAIEKYERALRLRPGWAPALTNIAIARVRAKALEKKGGEMTGGKLAADEYVFSNTPSTGKEEQELVDGAEPGDAEKRAIWLRQVQTRPADFLRSKFAYQYQLRSESQEHSLDKKPSKEQVQE